MSNHTIQLQEELEKMRQDREFMFHHLGISPINKFTKMGIYDNRGWRKDALNRTNYYNCYNDTVLSAEEVLRSVDMRQFLLGMFWYNQGYVENIWNLKGDNTLVEITNDAFWLEFLRLGKAANWHSDFLHHAILSSDSPHLPTLIKFFSLLYLMSYSSTLLSNRPTSLPKEAFQRLKHIYFTKEQIQRWNKLPDLGLEPLFKKQVYLTNLKIDMLTIPISDWFTFALHKHRPDHVCNWLEHYSAEQLGMPLQDVMLYVVANYHGDSAAKVIKSLEKLSPGICANFQDERGNNLLWYTSPSNQLRWSDYYNTFYGTSRRRADVFRDSKIGKVWESLAKEYGADQKGRSASNAQTLKCLFALGISPEQPNNYGFTFKNLDDYGRMRGQRWQNTRLLKKMPTLDNYKYWQRIK